MTTNSMGLEQVIDNDHGLNVQLEVLEALTAPGDTENQQLICLLLELKRRRANVALDDAERAELLAYRKASKEPVAQTSEFYMRELDKSGLVQCWLSADASDPDFSVELFTAPPLQAVPAGWKMVPVEPTENMVVEGFESEPDSFFSDSDDWEAYKAMSGCQQAAHKARLCWAAMIAAAPKLTSEP